MTLDHDFKKFPELRNGQMSQFEFLSPHPQIKEDFTAVVDRIVDGDTVRLTCDFRDFDFPLRIRNIQAPELDEEGGIESARWLDSQLRGRIVDVKIDPIFRVSDWNRLIGHIEHEGIDIGELSIMEGHSKPWSGNDDA